MNTQQLLYWARQVYEIHLGQEIRYRKAVWRHTTLDAERAGWDRWDGTIPALVSALQAVRRGSASVYDPRQARIGAPREP